MLGAMVRPSVAVVGGGIAGITAALGLRDAARVVLFEAEPSVGGHILPVAVPDPRGNPAAVDTGFVVFVPETYPMFTRMLAWLGVSHAPAVTPFRITDDLRSLSFPAAELLELCGTTLPRACRRELIEVYRALLRVRREGLAWIDNVALGDWLDARGFDAATVELGVLPWVASFWGLQPETVREVSARVALREMARNAGPSGMHRVVPSTRGYLDALVASLGAVEVRRQRVSSVEVEARPRVDAEAFDHVVVATDAVVAGQLLGPSVQAGLAGLHYEPTAAVVHRDARFLPPAREHWTTFHHHRRRDADRVRSVTTWLFDTLHEWCEDVASIDRPTLLTTGDTALLGPDLIDSETVVARFRHRHLVSTPTVVDSLDALPALHADQPFSLAGSYMGLGALHEDAVCSGMAAAEKTRAQLGLDAVSWPWSG